MIIQPRGFKRESQSAALMLEIKWKLELIAAKHDCSKSFVIATLLAHALGIKGQPNYEIYKPAKSQKSVARHGRTSKALKFEQRKRRTA